ncbi:MAG TPA: PAS domain S-box protein [Propionicimonas sp.]|jgi:PAS domain S-box-containing protein
MIRRTTRARTGAAHRRTEPSSVAAAGQASSAAGSPYPFELDLLESVARIGSYSMDVGSGLWVSSSGLDAILGIDDSFERTVEGWASIVHPVDRAAMRAYFAEDVIAGGKPFDRHYRIVRADSGEMRWVHGRGALEFERSGRPRRMFGTIADITDRHDAEEALAASERRYAAIFDGTSEAILIVDPATLRLRWANAAATELLGYASDELEQMTIRDLHPPESLPAILDEFNVFSGSGGVHRSVPCLRKDGRVVLADIRASAIVIDGVPCVTGFFTDVTEIRRLEAHDRTLAMALDQTSEAVLITGPAGDIEYVNPAFERLAGRDLDALVGHRPDVLDSSQPHAVFEAMWRTVSSGAAWHGDLAHRRPDGEVRIAEASVSPVRGISGRIAGYVAVERDVTPERALEAERGRLVAAVEQTSDSVIIADIAGTIEYVNPAFERVSGFRREEVVGRNPRILKSGSQSEGIYRAMWRSLAQGQTWTGPLVNRRKDGSLFEEEATISPIRGADGAVSGYVAVKRDVTAIRAAESRLAAEVRERGQVAAALARLQPGPTAEETAAAVCDELLSLPGIDVAAILDFAEPGRAASLAIGGPDGTSLGPGLQLSPSRVEALYERALQGAWAEPWAGRSVEGTDPRLLELDLQAAAYAPIRNGDGLLGLVVVGTRDQAYARHLIEDLPAVGEFAATASALLSRSLEWSHRSTIARSRILRVLADRSFEPVFQPIVALTTGRLVGFEALTRFTDGTPPDQLIAEASRLGLGRDLELATLAAAITAARKLPTGRWLSLNVSPDVIVNSSELAELVAIRTGPTVLEVTEHAAIEDYPAVRRAIARLGPSVSLAVDDAGAGFASLRHVVELNPQFLKVDISLVRAIDRDLTRQAMVAGLAQFAQRARCTVIAEGIEHRAELVMLRELGVPHGQGYLLGRPGPLPARPRRQPREGHHHTAAVRSSDRA